MATTQGTAETVQIRARLTDDEWLALRTLALNTRRPVADLVAAALRVSYPSIVRKEDDPA